MKPTTGCARITASWPASRERCSTGCRSTNRMPSSTRFWMHPSKASMRRRSPEQTVSTNQARSNKRTSATERVVNVLVIDIGGTNVKMLASGHEVRRKFPSGRELTPEYMVASVKTATKDWDYEAVSIGFPGPILCGQPMIEPRNLGTGWMGFDFESAFGMPVKVINDAAMQALGSYQGGKMLFIGLGTGFGATVIWMALWSRWNSVVFITRRARWSITLEFMD